VTYAIGDGWAINFSSATTERRAEGGQVRPDNAAEWQLRAQYSLLFLPGN
jgi:hypothetical protein